MSSVYLSGPITGMDYQECVDLFADWEARMVNEGKRVLNPIKLDFYLEDLLERKPSRQEYLRQDLQVLLQCDEILMLPGWSNSKGAQLERRVASECGIKVTYWEEVV